MMYAQDFTPRIGTAYAIDIQEWNIDGRDEMQYANRYHTFTITFNSNNTVLNFIAAFGNLWLTFYSDGTYERAMSTIFTARAIQSTGNGRIIRNGRDFTLEFPWESSANPQNVVAKGRIR